MLAYKTSSYSQCRGITLSKETSARVHFFSFTQGSTLRAPSGGLAKED